MKILLLQTAAMNRPTVSYIHVQIFFSNGFDQKTDLAVTCECDICMEKIKTNPFHSFISVHLHKRMLPFQ